jgi:amino acid permease
MAWRSPASFGEAIMGVSVWRQHPPQAPFRERMASWRARNWHRAILAWFVLTLAILAVPVVPTTAAAIIAAGVPVLLAALP